MLKQAYTNLLAKPFHRHSLHHFSRMVTSDPYARVLIIGNGPSLNELTPELAHQYDIRIACNHFYNHNLARKIDIDFYCVSDPRLFFPIDWGWLRGVKAARPMHLVIPRKFFYLRALYRGSLLLYDYAGDLKLWNDDVDVCFDLTQPFPSGDTVVSDTSIPLAVALGYKHLHFAGIDLQHDSSGVTHAYDDRTVKSRRRDDDYLLNEWPEKTSRSLAKQFRAFRSMDVKAEVLAGSDYFRRIVSASMDCE